MSADPGAHGSALDAAEEALLRCEPPPDALAWVAAASGPRAAVRGVRPLAGGTSSAVHEILVADAAGSARRVVLRRYVKPDWLAEQPDLAEREAEVLQLLEDTPVPAPRLVAVIPSGIAPEPRRC